MKKKFVELIILFVLVAFLPFGACKNKEAREIKKVHLSTVANIGVDVAQTEEEEPYQFFTIRSIDCDLSGNIYVLDSKTPCIKIFNKNGQFLRKILRKGKGPDEIVDPYGLAINRFSSHIFVLQEYGYQLKEFDVLGRFITLYPLPEQFFYYFEFIDENRLVYISSGRYGEKKYSNIKILNLKILEIEQEFAPIERPSFSNAYQKFIMAEGILWTCPGDKMELIGYDMKTGKEVKYIPIEESYKEYKIVKGENERGKWWRIVFYNYAQPILINKNIYVLVTKQSFKDETFNSLRNPISKKLILYHLEKDSLNKVLDLSEGDFMDLGAVWNNRIILYSQDPYPHIKILEVSE